MATTDSGALRSYRDAEFPPAETPWREAAFSVIDLEMTGLDPASDEIISFATVTVSGGTVRFDDARYELVRPRLMPDWDTVRIHGLREVDLEKAAPLDEVIDDLLEPLTGRPIVAHVAEVERNFLEAALSQFGATLRNPTIDTAVLDRELRRLRGQRPAARDPISLGDMVRSLGLPVHRPHHADGDALTTAQAFIALATHLEVFKPQTVGSLEGAGSDTAKGPGLLSRLLRLGGR
ncbi:MAG TPA: exonuclease domain-containing protein [Solirubrobacterales bacterium]|nr:exonuclease domain-containing protein [Solirubrobacterales bacterium]